MGIIRLTKAQIEFLDENYPTLSYDMKKNAIIGILPFDLQYGDDGEKICDQYAIEIDLNNVYDSTLPKVRETKNRIFNIALAKKMDCVDLHLISFDGEMCIIIPPKIKARYPNGFDLQILLEHLQEHFYWISYYEKYNKPPWKGAGHGRLGYYELYLENREKYSEDLKKYCQCKSRSEFRRIINELRKIYEK